ncbi:MAG: glutamate-cysteine ligase family protein [Candidatus Spechtbacterales bacterium]|nr:glutamate-cysteine ligase family protein [Candidatus Spechtbacterales bacterium]
MKPQIVEEFLKNFSPEKIPKGKRTIGRETEHIAINEKGEAVDAAAYFDILASEKGWHVEHDGYYVVQATSVEDNEGRVITPEFTTSVMEVAYPPRESLHDIPNKDAPWFEDLRNFYRDHGIYFPGSGVHVVSSENELLRTSRRRYDALYRAIGPDVKIIALTASSQVSFKIQIDEIIQGMNVCCALSGPSIMLMANSSIWKGEDSGLCAARESVWGKFAAKRAGIPQNRFSDVEQYLEHMFDLPVLIEQWGSDYIVPQKRKTFRERLEFRNKLFPRLWALHEGTVWWNARPRLEFGTLEIRPNCAQPGKDYMAVSSFWLGIVENLDEAEALVNEFSWDFWIRLRDAAIKDGIRAEVDGINGVNLVKCVLDISRRGLVSRGLNEEIYLDILYSRVEEMKTPADKAREIFQSKGIEALIDALISN